MHYCAIPIVPAKYHRTWGCSIAVHTSRASVSAPKGMVEYNITTESDAQPAEGFINRKFVLLWWMRRAQGTSLHK